MQIAGVELTNSGLIVGIAVVLILLLFLLFLFWHRRKKALRQPLVSIPPLENKLSELSPWKQKPILPLDKELAHINEELQQLPQTDFPLVKRITRISSSSPVPLKKKSSSPLPLNDPLPRKLLRAEDEISPLKRYAPSSIIKTAPGPVGYDQTPSYQKPSSVPAEKLRMEVDSITKDLGLHDQKPSSPSWFSSLFSKRSHHPVSIEKKREQPPATEVQKTPKNIKRGRDRSKPPSQIEQMEASITELKKKISAQ